MRRFIRRLGPIATLCLTCAASPGLAEDPEILAASASNRGTGWTISVTLSHPDTGWEHYADGWEVLAPDGTRLGMRVLAHPHVNEQPFTRALSGVDIPEGIDHVLIRARCLSTGWAQTTFRLDLER